ncbi:hypothetical protein MM817_03180 [Acidibacillus sp. S0AB]|uniref:Uncharacterized protein n=1 Tax=Sulfoacidibacillus ferrooxidans TaxID=2005001 RepID=A0A9X2AD54_9BACL|nr:hypothetical protein [Sulfoacidibacillus ferrooxidans]
MNGQLVEYEIPTMVANDPTSDGNSTTYMPIWYVQQLLNNVGITTDTWNGTTWTIGTASGASTKTSTTSTSTPSTTSTKTPTNGMATKLDAVIAFYQSMHTVAPTTGIYSNEYEKLTPPKDPYTDVPQADWSMVYDALYHGYITADSATLFGSNDPATANTMDEQYMWSMGIPKNSPLQLSWNPGDGNAVQWANFYDLNTGVPTSGDLTVSQLNQLEQNFVTSQKGWYETSNGVYHFAFAPYNTYTLSEGSTWSASHSLSELKQSLVYASTITFKKIGGSGNQPDLLWTAPGFSIHSSFLLGISGGSHLTASTNGGKSYQSFDSVIGHQYASTNPQNGATTDPSNPIYVKTQGVAGVNLDPMPVGAGYGSAIEFTDAGVPEVQQQSAGM